MNGWVKLHRKIVQNDVYRFDPTARAIFIHLLLIADPKTGVWRGGRKQLALQMGNNENTVYKALKRLSVTGMVTLESNNRFTTITICNWGKYQGSGNSQSNSTSNNQVTTREQPSNTIIRNKKKELRSLDKSKRAYGNPDVNKAFEMWEEICGYPIKSKVKLNRQAAHTLIKQNGLENLEGVLKVVAVAQNERYAPSIADFADLRDKVGKLRVWAKKQQNKAKGTIKI